jgi:hypothetical protein
MKEMVVVGLLLLACGLFLAAMFLGATPAAARLSNGGLASVSAAGLAFEALP